jgi:hypothetical protein
MRLVSSPSKKVAILDRLSAMLSGVMAMIHIVAVLTRALKFSEFSSTSSSSVSLSSPVL